MIVLCQRWTDAKVVEALYMVTSEMGSLWQAFNGTYDPAKGETVNNLLTEGRSRFVGTGTVQTSLAWAFSHLSTWTDNGKECIDLKTFLDRMNAFIQQAETNLSALQQ
jgi:hypothetical protein